MRGERRGRTANVVLANLDRLTRIGSLNLDDVLPRLLDDLNRSLLFFLVHLHLLLHIQLLLLAVLLIDEDGRHLLLRDRHVLNLRQAHWRRDLLNTRLVVLGELDRRRDLEVLPVNLSESDALRLCPILLLHPTRRLPLLVRDASPGILEHLATTSGRTVVLGVERTARTTLDVGNELLRRHEDLGILLNEAVEVAEEGVGRTEEVELVVAGLAGGKVRREATTRTSGEEGGEAEDVPGRERE